MKFIKTFKSVNESLTEEQWAKNPFPAKGIMSKLMIQQHKLFDENIDDIVDEYKETFPGSKKTNEQIAVIVRESLIRVLKSWNGHKK